MSKDKLTTIAGALSGLCGIGKNFVPAEFGPILDAVAALGLAVMGYFIAKQPAK